MNIPPKDKIPNFGENDEEFASFDEDQEDYQKISTNKTKRAPAKTYTRKTEDEIKIHTDHNSEIRFPMSGQSLEYQEISSGVKTMGGPYSEPGLSKSILGPKLIGDKENDEGQKDDTKDLIQKIFSFQQKSSKFADRFDIKTKKADGTSIKSIFTGSNREVIKLRCEYKFTDSIKYDFQRFRVRKWKKNPPISNNQYKAVNSNIMVEKSAYSQKKLRECYYFFDELYRRLKLLHSSYPGYTKDYIANLFVQLSGNLEAMEDHLSNREGLEDPQVKRLYWTDQEDRLLCKERDHIECFAFESLEDAKSRDLLNLRKEFLRVCKRI
ncbi:unnamed protein product [Moneuplotes crassus]|uniref:Uncharacterized protein n=1 Tax=Euplotes crassus TaxID=5936 RepID=A0AAD1XM63_EUPCR|nr:unnamed protein product [Moneuplotes crassus]